MMTVACADDLDGVAVLEFGPEPWEEPVLLEDDGELDPDEGDPPFEGDPLEEDPAAVELELELTVANFPSSKTPATPGETGVPPFPF